MDETASRKWPQFLVLILCNICVLTFGMQVGWLSPLQPVLQSENSPLGTPPLTVEQISWIGSLPSISLILATPFFGYCLNRFGRKKTCFIATAPNLVHYLLLLFARDVNLIYVARLIGGFCSSGAFVMVPIYVNEIAEAHLRGFLGGLMGFMIKVGLIISYVLGSYTSYATCNLISSTFTIFFLLAYYWLPESPVYLVSRNKPEEARKVLEKLRGANYKLIEKEMVEIENRTKGDPEARSYSLRRFFRTATTIRALVIVCGIYTFQMMCGYPAIMRYAVNVFQNSSKDLSPDLAAIMVATTQLFSAFIGATLVDRLGRKSILMISTFFMFANLGIFSGYMFSRSYFESVEHTPLKFIPITTLLLYISSYALGYGSVPFVILPEIFSTEARAKASALSNIWISLLEFLVVKMFPTISNWIGLAPTFLIFAASCAAGLVFYHFVMIETKGLEFDEIVEKLSGRMGDIKNEELKSLKRQHDLERQGT